MSKQIRCHCQGIPGCRLCNGTGKYEYNPGPRGYIPFRCPTCEGKGKLPESDLPCATCKGEGNVDPANPPAKGMLDVLVKILFGA
jgi:DnaJ-class molecular chaperone